MEITWRCKAFDDLAPAELYAILQLRNEVFVVEQNCVYQDCDGKDPASFHFMGWQLNKLVAYTRLLPAGVAYEQISIGRVVTSPSARGRQVGRELMVRSIEKLHELFGVSPVKIGAQYYLKTFYESLGFSQSGDRYLEDGIGHIPMIHN